MRDVDARQTGLGAAAVWRSGVCAGTIDSSNGSEIEAPIPRKTVRLDKYFFVMNMMLS